MRTKNCYFNSKQEFYNFATENSFLDEKSVLIQIFSSELDGEILKGILQDIKSVLPQSVIIGATTDGEILESVVTKDKIVVSVSAFNNSTIVVGMQENTEGSFTTGEKLAKKLVSKDAKILFLFSDGLEMNGEFFLDGIKSVSNDIPIAGGMAGDAANFNLTYIFCNETIISNGAVGVAINSQKLHVNRSYSFNWQEIGRALVITKAKDNRVYEIEGESAVDVYARYLGQDVAESLPSTGIEFPLIIKRNGMKIARAVLGKENDGSLFFAGNIAEGDTVYFGYGNSNMILKESVYTRDYFSDVPVESIFIYSCMARRRFLEDAISAELSPLASLAPTSGFFTYGEFYKSDKCELLNQTMTVVSLSESDEKNYEDFDYEALHKTFKDSSATHNALSHLIQKTSHELKETNDNLESLVELKTQELQNKIIELENASKVKSDFLANMSHEIRTPLNAILGFVDILKVSEVDKERQKRFSIIKNSGNTLLTVINDILDFSKIESGKMILERRKFSTKKPFKEVGNLFYDRAKEDGINLRVHFSPNIPKFFIGDIIRIKQVASNFLSNAIKFTSKGGNVLMSIEFDEKSENLVFIVKDNGIGIDEKNLNKIFESFSQEDSTTTRRFGGTGLGLSISSALIEAMDGDIGVSSILGEGSEFNFSLPLLEADDLELSKDNALKKIDFSRQIDAKVMLVEDNITNQMLMNIVLEDIGLDVDIAENGVVAVEMFRAQMHNKSSEKYGIILMDENMPKMNGIEATKLILELEQENDLEHTPIVAVTANALATDRERFLSAGMDEFISKPIDHDFLIRVLHSFLLDD